MTSNIFETSPNVYARTAGFCYLLGSLTSVYGQMIVWGILIKPGNAREICAHKNPSNTNVELDKSRHISAMVVDSEIQNRLKKTKLN
jgi:hypothetical protein